MLWPLAAGVASRLALTLFAPAIAASDGSPAPAMATVVFGGDVVPHGDLQRSMGAHGAASMLGPLAPVLRAADVALLNLETPVVPSRPVIRAGMRFNVHADFVQALVDAGVDGVSVANNHSYDMGTAAVAETVRTLRGLGLRPIGGAPGGSDPFEPEEFPLAGGTLCVFAATRILNAPWYAPTERQARVAVARSSPPGEAERLLAAVRRHRVRCGAIVVSLHSGVEYQDQPMQVDRVFFRRVADAGADAVVGHHPHTPQPVELYDADGRQVPIFYSLGNLVSNQGNSADLDVSPRLRGRWVLALDARTREGLLAVLRFEAVGGGRLRLAEFGYVPLWTVNTHLAVEPGQAPMISAALMPREGGADGMLQRRWFGLLSRVGGDYLLPEASLPGAREAYETSERAVMDNRTRRATSRALAALRASLSLARPLR